MQQNYIIRNATEADAEAIINMHAKSWLDTYPNEKAGVSYAWIKERTDKWATPEKLLARRERLSQSLIDPDYMYKIAVTNDGMVIGLVCPFRDEEAQRVGGLYVDKAYQGKGLGKLLMEEILKWADPKRPLELEVASYNERAKAFYRKYGFVEVPDSEHLYDVIPVVK